MLDYIIPSGDLEAGASDKAALSQTSDALVEMGAPILNNLGFSGAAGLSVAIAVKVLNLFTMWYLHSYHPETLRPFLKNF